MYVTLVDSSWVVVASVLTGVDFIPLKFADFSFQISGYREGESLDLGSPLSPDQPGAEQCIVYLSFVVNGVSTVVCVCMVYMVAWSSSRWFIYRGS